MYNPDDFASSPHRAPRLAEFDNAYNEENELALNAIKDVINQNRIPHDEQYGWVEVIRKGETGFSTCGENIALHQQNGYRWVNTAVHPEYMYIQEDEEEELFAAHARQSRFVENNYTRSTRGSSKIFKGSLALMTAPKNRHESHVKELHVASRKLTETYEDKNFNALHAGKMHLETTFTYE